MRKSLVRLLHAVPFGCRMRAEFRGGQAKGEDVTMSSPKTDLEKQKRRHIGPLAGITIALGVALALFVAYLFYAVDSEPAVDAEETPAELPETGMPAEGTATDPMTPSGPTEPQVIEEAPAPEPAPLPGD